MSELLKVIRLEDLGDTRRLAAFRDAYVEMRAKHESPSESEFRFACDYLGNDVLDEPACRQESLEALGAVMAGLAELRALRPILYQLLLSFALLQLQKKDDVPF
jgi:hypothetical protein